MASFGKLQHTTTRVSWELSAVVAESLKSGALSLRGSRHWASGYAAVPIHGVCIPIVALLCVLSGFGPSREIWKAAGNPARRLEVEDLARPSTNYRQNETHGRERAHPIGALQEIQARLNGLSRRAGHRIFSLPTTSRRLEQIAGFRRGAAAPQLPVSE